MPIQDKSTIKSYFETGDVPTENQFIDLIDSYGDLNNARREHFPTIANNGTDSEHDLDIGAARVWVSDGSTEKLVDFTAMTKQIDAAWVAGTNQGGLDTGTVTVDTWYYIWAIYNDTTSTADYLLSASSTAPTMPGGYTFKRYAGEVLADGSANILAMRPGTSDDLFLFTTPQTELNTTTVPTSVTTVSVSIPPVGGWSILVWIPFAAYYNSKRNRADLRQPTLLCTFLYCANAN